MDPGRDRRARFEALLARYPRVGLTHLPTPLEPLDRLSARFAGPRVWVKRDDLTGLGLGGNKVRKLDVLLRQALAIGADTLVSGGVVQSNSQRLVAAAAARLGLACHLAVFHGRLTPPSPNYLQSGNVLLNDLFGAISHDVPWTGDRNAAIEALAEQLSAQGRRPFLVPYGASNALGAIGYASAIAEVAEQAAARGFSPAAIVHCSGSGGTQAGVVLGASLVLPETEVLGIDVDAEPDRVRGDVIRIGREAAARLELDFDPSRVRVVAGHAGPGYGLAHAATWDAMRLAARLEGLVLDPVYSGKGLAGLLALIGERRWRPGQDVVFIHTGGTPALFAYGADGSPP